MPTPAQPPLHQRWSTGDVEPQRALAYWVDSVCQSFLEIDIDSPRREQFRAQLDESTLGPAMLYRVEADTQTVHRTQSQIARSRDAYYILLQLRRGEVTYRQYGRTCRLRAGDCLLVDGKQPYSLDGLGRTQCIAVRYQQDWLARWLPSPEGVAGSALRGDSGRSAALAVAFSQLEVGAEPQFGMPAGVVAEQLAALLAQAAGDQALDTNPAVKWLTRLRHSLRDQCLDPELSPATFATLHGISTRYLFHLFASAGTTFVGELIQVRLEIGRQMLSDRRFATLSVGDIAAHCGFVEPSHFARRFRQAHGCAPSAFRARQLESI